MRILHAATLLFAFVSLARGAERADGPFALAAALEARLAAGDGALLPDAERALARHAGTVDLARGDWPEAFAERAGETVRVTVSPFTGCYEFFDEAGEVVWTVVPVAATTENWVAPFRHAEMGERPDDALYESWRLVDVWLLSHAENAESGGASSPGEPPRVFRLASPVIPTAVATNLCFTSFSISATSLLFTASWPTNDPPPDATLDLYGTPRLRAPFWTFLSSHPATNPPAAFSVPLSALPWHDDSPPHVHDATCASLTNLVVSPLDGSTVYTNAFWICATNRGPGETGFFRLGTHRDTDADGLPDARELLVLGTDPDDPDTDRDGLPDGWEASNGTDPLDSEGDQGSHGDPDGDGLNNGQERNRGTDPLLADTDGDGIPDGTTASEWARHWTWASVRHETNLVIRTEAAVPPGASACLRIGNLPIPLPDGEREWCLYLESGRQYAFELRATGGSAISATIVPERESDLRSGNLPPPRSAIPGFLLDDPDGAFSGIPRTAAAGTMARPRILLHSADGRGPCVHETPGVRRWRVTAFPGSFSLFLPRLSVEGFDWDGADGFSLSVADDPHSITNGTIRIAATRPGFSDIVLSAEIHRCEYDPETGTCALCGESHDVTGLSFSVLAGPTDLARVGSTNETYLFSQLHSDGVSETVPANWTILPEVDGGARLLAPSAPASSGGTAVSGAPFVRILPGTATNRYVVTARPVFAPGVSAAAPFTAVAIDAEPICNETLPDGTVVNPVAIPEGGTARFRVKVWPQSVADSDIRWHIVEGSQHISFEGPSYGREITLRGVSTSLVPVRLEVRIERYAGVRPTFRTCVMPITDKPVVAWIVRKNNGMDPVTTPAHVEELIEQANSILRQVCITCYVAQVLYTNRSDWVNLETYGTEGFRTRFNEMVSVPNTGGGLEVHFVNAMGGVAGVNNRHGMVLTATASPETFAHEAGHAMGLADIYETYDDRPLRLSPSDLVRWEWAPEDWSGDDERGFYPEGLTQARLIRRHVMFGYSSTQNRDFSFGDLYGLRWTSIPLGEMELSTTPVGLRPTYTPPYLYHD